jgi:hypothetical protein
MRNKQIEDSAKILIACAVGLAFGAIGYVGLILTFPN